jgi:hypothetical protein
MIVKGKDATSTANVLRTTSPSRGTIYRYFVDVGSGWAYYTPTSAIQELLVGRDLETVAKTRIIGLATHAVSMRPIGLLRNHVAKKLGVTDESPLRDKIKVNLIGAVPIQAVTYVGMLVGGMAWSGHYNWKASAWAWIVGVGLGIPHSIPYGWFQDRFRRVFGIQPAIRLKQ